MGEATKDPEAEAEQAVEAARKLMVAERYQPAINDWTAALALTSDDNTRFSALVGRANCYVEYASYLRNLPASESEQCARFDLEPLQLANLALKDAERAVSRAPEAAEAHVCKGNALMIQDEFKGAEAAYLHALSLDPASQEAKGGLAKLKQLGGVSVSRKRKLDRALDDFDCVLCSKLLFRPVTTPCGHTFCRACFSRSIDHSNKCPMCRRVLHTGRELPVTVVLDNIISAAFPNEVEARARELQSLGVARAPAATPEPHDGGGGAERLSSIPVFVMNPVLPGEVFALNIFEPRYRLMIRRCLEGNRKVAMTCTIREQGRRDTTMPSVMTECVITDCNIEPDGRLSIKCQGLQRMQPEDAWEVDGYRVCRPSRIVRDEAAADPEATAEAVEVLTKRTDAVIAMIQEMIDGAPREVRAGVRGLMSLLPPRPDPQSDGEAVTWWAASYSSLKPETKLEFLSQRPPAVHLIDDHALRCCAALSLSEILMMESTRARCDLLNGILSDPIARARSFVSDADKDAACAIM